jgi:hypothetical protein
MGAGFSYQGASLQHYHFSLVDLTSAEITTLPWSGGILIFAEFAPDPLYMSGGQNISALLETSPYTADIKAGRSTPSAYICVIDDEPARETAFSDIASNPAYTFPAGEGARS